MGEDLLEGFEWPPDEDFELVVPRTCLRLEDQLRYLNSCIPHMRSGRDPAKRNCVIFFLLGMLQEDMRCHGGTCSLLVYFKARCSIRHAIVSKLLSVCQTSHSVEELRLHACNG